jgi:type I restriction enzyme M protein
MSKQNKYIIDYLKPFDRIMNEFIRNGHRKSQVFTDLLELIIAAFCSDNSEVWDGKGYSPAEQQQFQSLLQELALAYQYKLGTSGWCDPLGTYYEQAGMGGNNGQFFTPEPICDFMARMVGNGETLLDCCCGSGRFLLAGYAEALEKGEIPYICAGDIDPVCVKMTAVNFLFHGIRGEVVCKDGLDNSDYRFGYFTCRYLNNPLSEYHGIPTIERLEKERSKQWNPDIILLEELKEKTQHINPVQIPTVIKSDIKQLELF